MSRFVVKLGSSIVADDNGEPRRDVLGAVCEVVAARRARSDDVILVTSGAIAHGNQRHGAGRAGRAPSTSCRPLSAVGQGKLYRVWDELLRDRGATSAQVLLTFFDLSARLHYLNARQTLTRLLDWGVVPVINENDTTTTDEISFGDNDFLAAQVAILVGAELLVVLTDIDGLFTADPARRRRRAARARGQRRRGPRAAPDRPHDRAARLGRDALEGRGGRDGDGGRHPDGGVQRHAAGRAERGARRLAGGGGRASCRASRATRASSCG